jgi:hypothetical protein
MTQRLRSKRHESPRIELFILTIERSGHIWRTMGNIRNAQERYGEALEYHERAVRNMKVTLGEKHYFTGDCFYSLGVDWMRQGDTEKAR